MTTVFFCAGAFLLCLLAANRSLRLGLLAVLGVGYGYGILRANFLDTWTYLTFDAAVLGLYIGQLWRPFSQERRRQMHDLRLWIVVLICWPTLLFCLSPTDSPLMELVGLRANIFLLPFLLLGARLSHEDVYWLAVRLAVLNLAVVALGIVEFFVGLEPFYPVNEVTDLIYRSKDLVGRTAHRIPASFSSAHAFAGTLVTTLPLMIGAWSWTSHEVRWHRPLLAIATMASLLGVFMAAARTHMITVAVLVAIVTFSGRLRGGQWVRWVLALGLVGYVVSGEERLQRFTTLQDTAFLAERWQGSVNEGFFEAVRSYPFGNGLAGGGTSVPYFLRENRSAFVMENEYARIGIEQGLPGLALWIGFLFWAFARWPRRTDDDWLLGRRLSWVACAAFFLSGLTGLGLLSSVPQTTIMLITMGWFLTSARPSHLQAWRPAVVPQSIRPGIRPVSQPSIEPTSN